MDTALLTHLVLLHGEAAALWDVVLAVLAAEQAGRQGTPDCGSQTILSVQLQVVALNLQAAISFKR